jgi:hypothetical protein
MRAIAEAFYRNPVLFLGAVQAGLTAAAAEGAITGWIPVASLAVVTAVQRQLVEPRKEHR